MKNSFSIAFIVFVLINLSTTKTIEEQVTILEDKSSGTELIYISALPIPYLFEGWQNDVNDTNVGYTISLFKIKIAMTWIRFYLVSYLLMLSIVLAISSLGTQLIKLRDSLQASR